MVPHAEMDAVWWTSGIMMWLSPIFVALGLLMDYKSYTKSASLTRRLLNNAVAGASSGIRRGASEGLTGIMVSAIASALEDVGSFACSSSDEKNWILECDVPPAEVGAEPMPCAFELDSRMLLGGGSTLFLSSSEETPFAQELQRCHPFTFFRPGQSPTLGSTTSRHYLYNACLLFRVNARPGRVPRR